MSFDLEFTLHGVLQAGNWATEQELARDANDPNVLDFWRNRLIWKLDQTTDRDFYTRAGRNYTGELQGQLNPALIGYGAVLVFLQRCGQPDRHTVDTSTHEQRREALIALNVDKTGRPVEQLKAMSDRRLVEIGLQWLEQPAAVPLFGDPDNKAIDPAVLGYFQMMLERARTHYLASNTDLAQQLLDWINDTFPPLPLKSEFRARIQPLSDAVNALRNQLGLKLDYYGQGPSHVPVCSLEYYQARSESLLAALDTIEGRYRAYLSEQRADAERHADYKTALDQTKALITMLESERKNTQAMIKGTVADLRAMEDEVEKTRGVVVEKTHGLGAKVQAHFGVPSPEQLAGVLLNLSFMPEKQFAKAAMIGSQVMTVGADTVRAMSTVRMDDGTEIDRSLVVNRFDVLGQDVTNLSAGYTVSRNYIEKDAGIYRILQKAEQFEEWCRKFYESTPAAREAQTTIEDYVRAIKYRNAKIDEYNALWARLGDVGSQLAKLNAERDEKSLALARSEQPGLAHRVAAFDNLYNQVRDSTVKALYSMGRAYSFWALKPYDELTQVCKLSDPDAIDHSTLLTALTQIKNDCTKEIEGCRSALRVASMPDAGADSKIATGIMLALTKEQQPDFFEALCKKGVARFRLPLDHPAFSGKANVRVTRVRAWVHGMKTKADPNNNMVHEVTITHCGPETIVTTDRKKYEFQHDRVSVAFRYDATIGLEDPRAIFEGRGGPHDGVILEESYAPIGPFTRWRIAVLEDNNPYGLDRNGITKVVMEFHVLAQNFDDDSSSG